MRRRIVAANHLVTGQSESAVSRAWVAYLIAGVAALRFLLALAGGSWRGALVGLILAASLLVGMEAASEMGVNPGLPARVYSGRNRLLVQVLRGGFVVIAGILAVLAVTV